MFDRRELFIMIYFGLNDDKQNTSECSICGKQVKIQGDSFLGYSYRCVCGHKEEYGKLPKGKYSLGTVI